MKLSVQSPTHLEKHTTFYTGGGRLLDHEWRGQLRDDEGGTQWRIKYYGELLKKSLVVS